MKRFADEIIEEIYYTRFAPGIPEHVAVKAHKVVHPLVAACSLQDVDVYGPIYKWSDRRAVHVDGKWYLTFDWVDEAGAFAICLERLRR
jgi:hypothetical protein